MFRPYLACIFVAFLLLSSCSDEKEKTAVSKEKNAPMEQSNGAEKTSVPAAPLVQVGVIEAQVQTLHPEFDYPVTIEATETAAMKPQVAGVIKKIYFSPGSVVHEGDLLVELDDADYQVMISEIEANVTQAKASAQVAAANFERAKKLQPKGYVSKQDFDVAESNAISANSLIDQLKAKLKKARLDLDHVKIYAPFSGKISQPNYGMGDYVAPTSPNPLFKLVKLDPIYGTANVDIKVYERYILKQAKLKGEGKEIPEIEFKLRLATGDLYPYAGKFENWDNTAMGSSGTIAGRVMFPNPDGLLLPGYNLTLTGSVAENIEQIVIPQKAVSQDQQGHYVFLVNDEDSVERRNIEVGIRYKKNWTISDGLKSGDRVVTTGLQKIRPGMKVKPEREAVTN